MRIVHSVASLTPAMGGPFASIGGLARAQAVRGHEVEIVSPGPPAHGWNPSDWPPANYRHCGGWKVPKLEYSAQLARCIRELQPDVLHTQGLWQHPSWVANRIRDRVPLVHLCSTRGMLHPWALGRNRWRKKLTWLLAERRNMYGADLIHATSDEELQHIRALGITTPVVVIPNGVELPAKPALPDGKSPYALFLSRVHPGKGLEDLLRVWSKLRPSGWRLKIAGGGGSGFVSQVHTLAGELGLGELVEFCGPVYGRDKDRLYQGASLFVLPTVSENFGIAIAEALAFGVPVITTTGAPWAVIKRENLGWWIEPTEPALAEAMKVALQTSGSQLLEMGARGRSLVAQQFSWRSISGDFDESIAWIRGQAERPRFAHLAE
jgi:glycosyltransferase involved in cell wall biosynthesis